MSTNESVEQQVTSLHTGNGLPHANELKTLQESLGPGFNRADSHDVNVSNDNSVKMPPLNPNQLNSTVAGSSHNINFSHSEQPSLTLKKEPNDAGPKNIGEPLRFEVNSADRTPADGLVTEEPLEIQCGENAALLYVSKLCQGSKGPCILFQGEWLTPNELQYISGRETAKDWKRSIRYKGKSLKSLIARGLIKVHPPICDCLGCRISSPVVRKYIFYLYNKPLIVICFIFSRTCVTSWRSYSTDAKAFFGHSHSWWVNLHASSTIFFLFHLRGLNLLWGIINEAVDGFISTPVPISIISVQRDSLTYKNRLLSLSGSTHYDNNGLSLEEMALENSMTICEQWH